LRAVGLVVLVFVVAPHIALWFLQDRFIYVAPHYTPAELTALPPGLVALHDPSAPGSVLGFYRAPSSGQPPRRLWLLFGGNGNTALRWDPLIAESATDQGFLLVEYPGYGARAGRPSPQALRQGTEVTIAALAQQLKVKQSELSPRIAVVGYSLGAAAALDYASLHPVQRIILFAPFTTMLDMARRFVGSPVCHLLSHRYDNIAALHTIEAHGAPPLTILHGDQDDFIPPNMGRALAARAPGCHFELVPGAHHGDLIEVAQVRLRELVSEP
jgi:pimeloyl-ACP methyl ester carboxylesterase